MKNTHIAILALTAAAVLAGCKDQTETRPPARPVLSMVIEHPRSSVEGFAGAIEPRYRAAHGFRLLGRVITRDVNVGDFVRKGARLAALDPIALDFAVNAARADLATASAQFANASGIEKRRRILVEQKSMPPEQFEAAQQAREAAKATVTRARTALDKAVEQRGYAELLAEFDGVVTSVDTEMGQMVSSGQAAITVARPEVRDAVIDAPDDICAGLHEGDPFEVALQIDPGRRETGRVREISPQVDPLTHSRRVKIALEAPQDAFRLGSTITAYLSAAGQRRITIPASALLERDAKTLVWVVDPATNTVTPRDVAVASRDGQSIVISSGLEAGVRIAIAGVHSLVAGQSVRIPEEAPQ
jgi:membrane fusion protein, multidrug efflux system